MGLVPDADPVHQVEERADRERSPNAERFRRREFLIYNPMVWITFITDDLADRPRDMGV
jgi:hypothetical protein